eukprot:TRINITY_DN12852_c2_g2_i1.p1 TRINITY_DN12852_c2_g2~~TRINITY_DN12852_c2_g2_i1.p1  ORF type:complete len:510 (+),score=62.77 TRINITY_DN12852_c2_g2_i1:50-1531(+)
MAHRVLRSITPLAHRTTLVEAQATSAAVASATSQSQRQIATQWTRSAKWTRNGTGADLWLPRRGFQRREYGLDWYPTKDDLFHAGASPVLVGCSYEYEAISREGTASLKQARKYSSFESHEQYWDKIGEYERDGLEHNLHEIFDEMQPRCLYFDLDGHPSYKGAHQSIVGWLKAYVRWFFGGDRLNWKDVDPDPVVLTSSDPGKYSCHVVFPQIQFANYGHQCLYMPALLSALPALVVDLEDNKSVPILEQLVDRVPYTRFQLFRGPYACKLKAGKLERDSKLEPEGVFKSDPLACFASHVEPDYALQLPKLTDLLDWNEELRHYYENQHQRITSCNGTSNSLMDQTNLFVESFQSRLRTGNLDLAGLTPIEQFEVCLKHLHPDRASDWWSWFRICGVTYSVLEKHGEDEAARDRIWKAHFDWSANYPWFGEDENADMVMQASGRPVSGISLLKKLVKHDNPCLKVREAAWAPFTFKRPPLTQNASSSFQFKL